MNDNDQVFWEAKWKSFEIRLKQSVHLEEETDMNAAMRQCAAVKSQSKNSVQDVSKFLDEYKLARAGMLEQELLSDTDPKSIMREIEDFKIKIADSTLLTYLLEMSEFPKIIESDAATASGTTLLGRCRQFAKGISIGRSTSVGGSPWICCP